jgi:hypothetical protein
LQKLNVLAAVSLSALLFFSTVSVSNAQFDDEEIVKVRAKQGKTLVMILVRNSDDFGIDIYGFTLTLTNGDIRGFKGPKTWEAERDGTNHNAITFSTSDDPMLPGKGKLFRFITTTNSASFEWMALDEDGEEFDSGTVSSSSRISTMEKPVPTPSRPSTTAERVAVLSVSPEKTMPGSMIKIAGKGFAPNSAVELMLDESGLVKVETDSNGYFVTEATIPKEINLGMHKIWGKDTSSNFASVAIMIGEHEEPQRPHTLTEELAVKTASDHYPQSATVVIMGHGTPDSTVELQVTNPLGEVILQEKTSIDKNGMFGVKMQLGTDTPTGMYIVYAKQEEQEAKSRFMVMSPEKPIIVPQVLSIHTEHERYHGGENVVIFGKATPGSPVSIVVMSNTYVVFKGEARVLTDGSYRTAFTLDGVGDGTYVVTAHQDGASASTKFFIGSTEREELKVDTDSDHYRPGQVVTIFGGNAHPEKRIELAISYSAAYSADIAANGALLYKDVLVPSSDGSFKTTYTLEDVKAGIYIVTVMQDGISAMAKFAVEV